MSAPEDHLRVVRNYNHDGEFTGLTVEALPATHGPWPQPTPPAGAPADATFLWMTDQATLQHYVWHWDSAATLGGDFLAAFAEHQKLVFWKAPSIPSSYRDGANVYLTGVDANDWGDAMHLVTPLPALPAAS